MSGKGDGDGEPADVRMSGQPGNCYGGILNGVWAYEGDTADGKRFYSRDTGNNERYRGVIHLYFDKDSDNGKSPGGCGEGAAYNNKWYIDEQKPSTTAANDLDGDGSCFTYLSSRLPDTSGSLAPPASAEWTLQCNGKWTGTTLFFQPICESPAPDWTYTFPDEWTTVLAGCGTGISRQRTAAESCPARGGCDCQNRRATLPTETEPQEPCQSSPDGEGDPADVWMGGQPVGCNGGGLNGAWAYEGDTADGKRYYSRAVGSVYASNGFPVLYLYFDRDSDNGQNPVVCGTGAKGNNDWHIDNNKPSTTAAQDLDGDNGCVGFAASIQPDTSGSPTPPATTEWGVTCSGQVAFMTLSSQPICETPAPDWSYIYPDEWTVVNAGCGTGIAQQRIEVEACPARRGCGCTNRQSPESDKVMQLRCMTATTVTTVTTVNPCLCYNNQKHKCVGGKSVFFSSTCLDLDDGLTSTTCCSDGGVLQDLVEATEEATPPIATTVKTAQTATSTTTKTPITTATITARELVVTTTTTTTTTTTSMRTTTFSKGPTLPATTTTAQSALATLPTATVAYTDEEGNGTQVKGAGGGCQHHRDGRSGY